MQRATYVYASAKSRARIEAILEDCYADGEVNQCEVAGIKQQGGRWVLLLWAE